MKICNSLYWYVDRSVGDKVGGGNYYRIDIDIDVEYRSGNGEWVG